MFLGHFALGFWAKRYAPKQNAAVLVTAPGFLDVVWPALILTGVERASIVPGNTVVQPLVLEHMPWSHSLLMSIFWSVAYAGGVLALTRDRRGALISGLLVFSHWVLDLIAHRPDLQLVPWNETRFGLGLWNSLPGTLLVEGVLFATGCWMYLRSTRPEAPVGKWGPIAFMAVLVVAYLGSVFGPPPPSAQVAALGIVLLIVLLPFVWWFDRRRVACVS